MERTFNMGVGMLAVCSRSGASATLARLSELGVDAWACGTVEAGESRNSPPSVEVAGCYA
jgi:phosphoribosylformylglycinamidine cyclo-ligase